MWQAKTLQWLQIVACILCLNQTLLAYSAEVEEQHPAAKDFPIQITNFTAQNIDGYNVKLTWIPSAKPDGLSYTVNTIYAGSKKTYLVNDSQATETTVKLFTPWCADVEIQLIADLNLKCSEPLRTVFQFPPGDVQLDQPSYKYQDYSSDVNLQWKLIITQRSKCAVWYNVTITDREPLNLTSTEYTLTNVEADKTYFVVVQAFLQNSKTLLKRSVNFKGRHGGVKAETLKYTAVAKPGAIQVLINESFHSHSNPVKSYHVEWKMNSRGFPSQTTSTSRTITITDYQACNFFGLKVFQETMDGVKSDIPKDFEEHDTLPFKPNTPTVKCEAYGSGIRLQLDMKENNNNHFCKKAFEIKWYENASQNNVIITNDKSYFVNLFGRTGMYHFRVRSVIENLVYSDNSGETECFFNATLMPPTTAQPTKPNNNFDTPNIFCNVIDTGINVTWTANRNSLFRLVESSGNKENIIFLGNFSYFFQLNNTDSTTFGLKVAEVTESGDVGPYSKEVFCTYPDNAVITTLAPGNATTPAGTGIKLTSFRGYLLLVNILALYTLLN